MTRLAYRELESAYKGTDSHRSETDELKALGTGFCISCYHMKDWLRSDPAMPLSAQQRVEAYVKLSTSLSLCGDVANSAKHRNRHPGQTEARIAGIRSRTDGGITRISMHVSYHRTDGSAGRRDVLDLAREAMEPWLGFFVQHGLQEPSDP